jgi:prepilin-type N-terminal cleavage/methylation domain-containing protein
MKTPKSKKCRGFSLIEMLIVLGLIGILGGLVAVNTSAMFDNDIGNNPEEIFFSLAQEARISSLETKQIHILSYDEEKKVISLQNSVGESLRTETLPEYFEGPIRFKILKYKPGEKANPKDTTEVSKLIFHPSASTQPYIVEFEYENYVESIRMDPLSNLQFIDEK